MVSKSFLLKACLAIVFLVSAMQPLAHGQAAPAGGRAPASKSSSDPAVSPGLPAEPPGTIYKEAMRPLDVVRSSMDNWSDAEMGALASGMHKAQEACGQIKPKDVAGDDLYDLARLCSFGQEWNDANTAALAYVGSGAETHKAEAYALTVYAQVHLNAIDLAVRTAEEMLRKLPYDAEVAYSLRDLKVYLEQSGNPAP